jgi:predicted small secreted protein
MVFSEFLIETNAIHYVYLPCTILCACINTAQLAGKDISFGFIWVIRRSHFRKQWLSCRHHKREPGNKPEKKLTMASGESATPKTPVKKTCIICDKEIGTSHVCVVGKRTCYFGKFGFTVARSNMAKYVPA